MTLALECLGIQFQNPVLLASGTCGFGAEVLPVTDVEALGGFVTKSVTLEPRAGNPAPRVTEFRAGMLNSVGLANPGARVVREEKLPWIAANLTHTRVFVSVAGHKEEDYLEVVDILDDGPGFVGFELNLSCPNDARRSGVPFALDAEALGRVVSGVRNRTDRVLLVKLAPNTPDLAPVIQAAELGGADGLTLVNTMPGFLPDREQGGSALGAGAGGMSGPALKPVGLHAVQTAAGLTGLPLVGVGGISSAADAVEYLEAGASLVQIGTASFWDPRTAERVVHALRRFQRSGERGVIGKAGRGNRGGIGSRSVLRDPRVGSDRENALSG